MEKIDLTFGIPAYNAEKYIQQLLDCFKETNAFTYEVIIVDDGSDDDTYGVCKRYPLKIRLYKKKNAGVSSARNLIIEKSNGKWITFVDADDLIDFNKYEARFSKIINGNDDFCIGYRKKIKINNKTKQIYYLIENEIINSPWDKFYTKSLLQKKCIRFDESSNLGEDLLFNLTCYKKAKHIGYYDSNEMYTQRTINDNSLTHKFRSNKYDELIAINDKCLALFLNDRKATKSLEYICVKNCLSCAKDLVKKKAPINIIKNTIKTFRLDHPIKFLCLNNIKTTAVYYVFHYFPILLIIKIIEHENK